MPHDVDVAVRTVNAMEEVYISPAYKTASAVVINE